MQKKLATVVIMHINTVSNKFVFFTLEQSRVWFIVSACLAAYTVALLAIISYTSYLELFFAISGLLVIAKNSLEPTAG